MSKGTAIVTGAAGGIGLATCVRLADAGYGIGMIDRDPAALEAAAAGVPGAIARAADITDELAVAQAIAGCGFVPDLLVNNAGIVAKGALLDQDVATFRRVIDVNLVGALVVTRAVAPAMIARGSGSIVNVTSIAGVTPNVGGGGYGPSKAALLNLTQLMALEWAAHGIRVNAVAPGTLAGGMASGQAFEAVQRERAQQVPLGRLGTLDEVADAILFLGSDAARYITGQQILVDGGLSLSTLARLAMPPPPEAGG